MEIKCGNDTVLDERIGGLSENKGFLSKVFHPSELVVLDAKKLASIFALKESVIKALESTTDNWLDIEVVYKESGKPRIVLSDKIRPRHLVSVDCSVTHENGSTYAIVVLLLQDKQ